MEFEQRIEQYRQRVENTLQLALPDWDYGQVTNAMAYSTLAAGKRLRPLLTYATGELLDIDQEILDPPATAVELIHCYSLIHDDLPAMDDDELRRGKATTHIEFGEATAILAGDAIQALAYELLSAQIKDDRQAHAAIRAVAVLARAAGAHGMVGGQALDLSYEGKQPQRKEVEQMFELKTGALIEAAILLACCYQPELTAGEAEQLAKFGATIGLAFQIHDDVLDVIADTQTLGKPQGSDAAQDKASYPARFGLEAAQQRVDELYSQAVGCLKPFGDKAEGLLWLADYLIKREY